MYLEWLNETGLLERREDTGVLRKYPLGIRIAIVEQVVSYFDRDYGRACEGMTHLAHLQWTIECTGAAFTLPLPSCQEIISKTIKLYRVWLKEPQKRPILVSENFVFLTDELVKHLSLLFTKRANPATQANKDIHVKLCTDALDLLASLGHHVSQSAGSPRRDVPSIPEDFLVGSFVEAHSLVKSSELNGKVGRVVGYAEGRVLVLFDTPEPRGLRLDNLRNTDHALCQQNWATVITVLLGVCDYTITTHNGLKELEYIAVSVLFEAIIRSKIYSDSLWSTLTSLIPKWVGCMAVARQWSATLKALTLGIQLGIQKSDLPLESLVKTLPESGVVILWEAVPKGFRKASEIELAAEEAMMCWRRFLHLIGDPNLKEPKVFSQAMQGLRVSTLLISYCGWFQHGNTTPVIPQASPCTDSLVRLVGPWLLHSIPSHPDTLRKDGKATALTMLTELYLRQHQIQPDFREFLAAVGSSAEQATEPLTDEHAVAYRCKVLEACKHLFTFRIPDVCSALPAFIALLGRVIRYPEGGGRGESIPQHVEDFDTDDEFDGLLIEHPDMEQDMLSGSATNVASDEDETVSPSSQELPRRMPPKAREGSLLDGCDVKTRLAGFTVLSSLIPFTYTPKLRADVRLLLLRSLASERESRCLSTVLQICVQWIHHEMNQLPQKLPRHPDDADTLTTVSDIIAKVQLLLEGIQGWARQTVEVYFAAIKTIQHGALPYCSSLATYPPPAHPAREALVKADPSLPNNVASSLAKFILYLHGKQNKDFNEASIGMLCSTTLSCMSDWISHCPSIVTHKETIKEVMDAVEIALGMKNSESLSLPSDALAVFRACMCSVPPHPAHERSNVSSEISEQHLTSSHTKRYFALDGTKILTVINHTHAKDDSPALHRGGVTTIVRDAFGRHVWDARLHLDRVEGEGLRTRPSTMIHRRHGISLGPERLASTSATTSCSIEEAFEPLIDLLPELETDDMCEEMKRVILSSEEESETACGTIPPMAPYQQKEEEEPDQGRLFLSHLQLLSSSGRVVELKETPELLSALAMLDMTPARELHRISIVYLHDENGCASLQDLGMEWYVEKGDGFSAAELPSFGDFTSFVSGLGWPIDPSEHPQAYSGGAVGEKWRRQRIHYYSDTRYEAVWAVSAATPSSWEKSVDSLSGERWEDKTPVRVVWNDTNVEYNPSAMNGEVVREMSRQLPSWSPRTSKTLDFVITPLENGLVSIRVILPLANERWQALIPSAAFDPAIWHSPVLDGTVVSMSVLPTLLRQACVTASQAFRTQWQRLYNERRGTGRNSEASQRQGFTYLAPELTRAVLLQRSCSGLRTVSGVGEAAVGCERSMEGARVSCIRHIDLKSGRKLLPGTKGVVTKIDSTQPTRIEVYFDTGVLYDARVGVDVMVEHAAQFNWDGWRCATRCVSADLATMFTYRR